MFLIKLCIASFLCLLLSACNDRIEWISPYDVSNTGSHDEHGFGPNADSRYLPTTDKNHIPSETKNLLRFPVFITPRDAANGMGTHNAIAPAILNYRPATAV